MEPIKVVILDGGVPWEVVEAPFDDVSLDCTAGGIVVGVIPDGDIVVGGVVGNGGLRMTFGGQVEPLA